MNPTSNNLTQTKKTQPEAQKPSKEEGKKPEEDKEDTFSGNKAQLDNFIEEMKKIGFGN